VTPFAFCLLLALATTKAAVPLGLPSAQPAAVGLSAERLARIDESFQRLVDERQLAGALTLVSRRGRVAHLKTYGWRDVEAQRPMQADSIFRIASMTKAVTAVAVLQLLERGEFRLDDPISRFIPAFAQARVLAPDQSGADPATARTVALAREVTIRDLLRHTSGIDYGDRYKKAGLRDWQGSLSEFVDRLVSVPLACQPRTEFRYSYSTDVLGLLVEIVSGKPLDRYFDESIFAPLDMRDTGFVVPADKVRRLTNHYEWEDGALVCREMASASPFLQRAAALSGGGGWSYSYPGLVTTARDWWRFLEMLRNYGRFGERRILGRKTVELMCVDHLGSIPGAHEPGTGHGLGVGVITDSAKHGQLASTGTVYWAGGPHNTYYFVDFQEEMCGILLVQNGPWRHKDMMRRFLTLAHQAIDD
jgi:CubicO group peptidase (beta-lactamase class C family)